MIISSSIVNFKEEQGVPLNEFGEITRNVFRVSFGVCKDQEKNRRTHKNI